MHMHVYYTAWGHKNIIRPSIYLKQRHLIHPFVFSHCALMLLILRLRSEELGVFLSFQKHIIEGGNRSTQNHISNIYALNHVLSEETQKALMNAGSLGKTFLGHALFRHELAINPHVVLSNSLSDSLHGLPNKDVLPLWFMEGSQSLDMYDFEI